MKGPRANLTTPHAVMSAHGGELTFWLAWLSGELNPEVCDWFRTQARKDDPLLKDLESVDRPAAPDQLPLALEATGLLTPRDRPGEPPANVEPLTGFAVKDPSPMPGAPSPPGGALDWIMGTPILARGSGRRELHRRVSRSLFQLLAEVEVPLPAGDEAREATALLHYLAGYPAVDRFRRLDRWLHDARQRAGAVALDRVLRWLAPELFESDHEGFRHHLSFRLFLRGRLKDYCKQRDWKPAGPRYRDLDTAFARLQRDRIGQIVYQAIDETPEPGLEEAKVSSRQVLQWLQVAP